MKIQLLKNLFLNLLAIALTSQLYSCADGGSSSSPTTTTTEISGSYTTECATFEGVTEGGGPGSSFAAVFKFPTTESTTSSTLNAYTAVDCPSIDYMNGSDILLTSVTKISTVPAFPHSKILSMDSGSGTFNFLYQVDGSSLRLLNVICQTALPAVNCFDGNTHATAFDADKTQNSVLANPTP